MWSKKDWRLRQDVAIRAGGQGGADRASGQGEADGTENHLSKVEDNKGGAEDHHS